MRKRNCKSLEVQAEMKLGSETSHLWKSWQNKCGKRDFRFLPVKTEQKSGSAEAELHIFGSQGRVKARKRNFIFLAVKAERMCGRGFQIFGSKDRAEAELQIFGSQGRAADLYQSRQGRSVKAENQIFSRQDGAEVRKQNCRSLTVQSSWTFGSRT